MMRKARQFNISCSAVLALSEHDAQDARRPYGILTKGFIEVTYAKKQQRIRVFHLDAVVLLHQRCFYNRGGIFFVDGAHGNFVDLKGIKSKTAATFL